MQRDITTYCMDTCVMFDDFGPRAVVGLGLRPRPEDASLCEVYTHYIKFPPRA